MSLVYEISVGFVGLPNAGKSTLLNQCLDAPLAATSSTPGTTRSRIVGISHVDDVVIQWIDAPGFYVQKRARERLKQCMHDEALAVVGDVSIVCAVIDASQSPSRVEMQLHEIIKMTGRKPQICILNKIDLLGSTQEILPIIRVLSTFDSEMDYVPMSGKKGLNKESLIALIVKKARQREVRVDASQWNDSDGSPLWTLNNQRQIAHDWIRGALIEGLRHEVPLSTEVLVDQFDEDDNDIRIRATVLVEKASQKPILIGAQASRLKKAGMRAREILKELFQKEVHVQLHVSVKDDWTQKEGVLHELGY